MQPRSIVPVSLVLAAIAAYSPGARAAAPATSRGALGGFLDLEWRAMGLGGHFSHGSAFAAGVTLLDGHLRLVLAGLNRPGPWNPATFDVTLPEGRTYRGKRRLELRSDGAMAGAHIALASRVPRLPLAVTLPLTLGYGGFGFYLHGADRSTPDGRRVSAWEDELFGGKDSFLGLVTDGGIRAAWVLEDAPWFRPDVAGYYTLVPGFDTLVRGDYAGPAAALGIELGHDL